MFLRGPSSTASFRALRLRLCEEYAAQAELISVHSSLRRCRDPRDDLFLNLAVDGRADVLLTGNDDLLALDPLDPFPIAPPTSAAQKPTRSRPPQRSLRILTPGAFLALAD